VLPARRAAVGAGFDVGPQAVTAKHERLRAVGVPFTQAPLAPGPVTTPVFDDTCANLIQIATAK
jgi:hypothetical protein